MRSLVTPDLSVTLDAGTGAARTGTADADYRVESGSDLAAFLARTRGAQATAFQTGDWLHALYATIAQAQGAEVRFVVVTAAGSERLVLALPLAIVREGGLRVATIASFGVSDYCAPLLGPAAPTSEAAARRLWSCIARQLEGIDLVRLSSMPSSIAERVNPLSLLAGVTPSRHSAHWVTLTGTVEEFLRSRGKKYRKEAERCYRLLEKAGQWRFVRADAPEEMATVYQALSAQQRARRERAGGTYLLDRPEYDAFYEHLATEGSASGFAHLFTLEIEGEPAATLFGVTQAGSFTLLRISTSGERHRQLSPGRLVVLEAMRYFIARDVRTFDMGIGDYAFKDGLGAEAAPLADITIPLTLRARPHALLAQAKAKARDYPRLFNLAKRIAGRG